MSREPDDLPPPPRPLPAEPLASLDQLLPGQAWAIGTLSLSAAEIVEFARRYDPQPFHLDPEAAKDSIFRELVASGLHTYAAVFSLVIQSNLLRAISLGGNAFELRWPAPLRPDEPVSVRVEVLAVTPSRTRSTRGTARLRYVATRVADGVVVLDAVGHHILRR
ncbi:acyl dehydratase [Roseomonas sp. NAR14]|uniref:Acyl dehydratase n=1 Tax=Roseomonas acroporae TaxID=2937791 RepID=A0A9X1Y8D6_9PROT|nr:MaoC/PaaZ C-terminal domain-containing protein [Roseomonas acroporae]MCK8785814.1 acyl dehydratase [Roseomonas acroporae]